MKTKRQDTLLNPFKSIFNTRNWYLNIWHDINWSKLYLPNTPFSSGGLTKRAMRNLLDQASHFCYNETSRKRAIFAKLNIKENTVGAGIETSKGTRTKQPAVCRLARLQSTRWPFVLPSSRKEGRGCFAGEQSSRCSPLLMWAPRRRTTDRNRLRNRVSWSLAVFPDNKQRTRVKSKQKHLDARERLGPRWPTELTTALPHLPFSIT